jgi:hypothetical protein
MYLLREVAVEETGSVVKRNVFITGNGSRRNWKCREEKCIYYWKWK